MKIALISLYALLSFQCFAQDSKKIDQIFLDWHQEEHPGGVVLVSKADKVVYSQSFGYANIQQKIVNTSASAFNIASVSKQFTALGIGILCKEGKLSIDDQIQQHLPELPDFGHPITIRNLLHHTSGIRSTPELFGLAGWTDTDTITTDDVLKYLCRQRDLNFTPGTEYMYSNSNYVLLALIIERVTKVEFSEWMKSNVFHPLGMTNTFVDATNSNVLPTVSTPYVQIGENAFQLANNFSHDIGASNVYSTAHDLITWLKQLGNPDEKWMSSMQFLLTTDTLVDGSDNNYARGLVVDEFKGNKRIYHNGGAPGNLSFVAHFPDDDLSIVVLVNYVDVNAEKRVDMLLSHYLKDKSDKREKPKKMKLVPLDVESAQNYCAAYWNADKNYSRTIFLENDTLWYLRTNGRKSPMLQVKDSCFVLGGIGSLVEVQFEARDGNISMLVRDEGKPQEVFTVYDSSPLSQSELEVYCGTFYSRELETSYTISLKDQQLMGFHSVFGPFEIQVLKRDIVDWSGFAVARYNNKQGDCNGFYLSIDRVKNVWFEKQMN